MFLFCHSSLDTCCRQADLVLRWFNCKFDQKSAHLTAHWITHARSTDASRIKGGTKFAHNERQLCAFAHLHIGMLGRIKHKHWPAPSVALLACGLACTLPARGDIEGINSAGDLVSHQMDECTNTHT